LITAQLHLQDIRDNPNPFRSTWNAQRDFQAIGVVLSGRWLGLFCRLSRWIAGFVPRWTSIKVKTNDS